MMLPALVMLLREQKAFKQLSVNKGFLTNLEKKSLGAVAQLARAPRSHRGGQGFDSPQLHSICLLNLPVYEHPTETMMGM